MVFCASPAYFIVEMGSTNSQVSFSFKMMKLTKPIFGSVF